MDGKDYRDNQRRFVSRGHLDSGKRGYHMYFRKSAAVKLEKREVIPSDKVQRVTPGDGYGGLEEVTVAAIPSNYGKITYDGSKILVS